MVGDDNRVSGTAAACRYPRIATANPMCAPPCGSVNTPTTVSPSLTAPLSRALRSQRTRQSRRLGSRLLSAIFVGEHFDGSLGGRPGRRSVNLSKVCRYVDLDRVVTLFSTLAVL